MAPALITEMATEWLTDGSEQLEVLDKRQTYFLDGRGEIIEFSSCNSKTALNMKAMNCFFLEFFI